MSLDETITRLTEISEETGELLQEITALADRGEETTQEQRDRLAELAESLDTTSREAARERRQAEIEQLTEVIDAHEATLAVPDLPADVREAVRADLIQKRARRTRLLNLEATDFGGILTAAEVSELEDLVAKAQEEAAEKKFAAEFLTSLMKIVDLSLSLAGKFAM